MKVTKGTRAAAPQQYKGKALDVRATSKLASENEARRLFRQAVARLQHVNRWDKICGKVSAVFQLVSADGQLLEVPAEVGHYFRIDIPGPGPAAGDGYDWVQVEAIEDRRDGAAPEESFTMRVRPSSPPLKSDEETAHFFDASATSTFRVLRRGLEVMAEVKGRNETPNTDVDSLTDKVRNAAVGWGAVAGLSAPQWKSLVKGLLADRDQ